LLYPIVAYFVLFDGQARRASREFLSQVQGRPARWGEVFAHLYSFATTLLDRVYMAAGDFGRFALDVRGREHLEGALAAGRGCVLMGSHLGSFDLVMLANRASEDRPVALMMHVDPRARLRRMAGIDESGLQIIAMGRPDSFLRAFEVLQRGGLVAVLADRAEGAAHLQSAFLGRPAPFPIGPHVLAARAGAPVVLFFGLYLGGARYAVEFLDGGAPAPAKARGAALQPVVDRYAQALAERALRHPLNWFNFYPFWTPLP
jgi:predicted LPLAT superfamily acyltransferase